MPKVFVGRRRRRQNRARAHGRWVRKLSQLVCNSDTHAHTHTRPTGTRVSEGKIQSMRSRVQTVASAAVRDCVAAKLRGNFVGDALWRACYGISRIGTSASGRQWAPASNRRNVPHLPSASRVSPKQCIERTAADQLRTLIDGPPLLLRRPVRTHRVIRPVCPPVEPPTHPPGRHQTGRTIFA